MSQYYTFPQPGCIPGVPGIFAGVSVTVNDDGTLTTAPLLPCPNFESAEELAESPAEEAAEEVAGEEF